VEEVLKRQTEKVRSFMLQTSILDWLSGPLCDAVTGQEGGKPLLVELEKGNLFVSPQDDKRHWFRYHHLFAHVLRVHLKEEQPDRVPTLHRRASEWYERNGLEIEAFQHAAAANDLDRAERLIEGEGMPLQFRGAGAPVLRWLESLPNKTLDARPSLWVTYASTLLFGGQHTAVEQKLKAAEIALQSFEQGTLPDDRTKDIIGRIASLRATLAVIQHDVETIISQSRRALEFLHPDNLPVRTATTWTLGYAYQLLGDRSAARQAYTEIIATGKLFGDSIYTIAATINLGQLQEADNQLALAAETYWRVLQLSGDPPDPIACEAFLGLARISYQWNDLDTAQQYGQQCLQLTRQMESISTFASCEVFLARLKLAQSDIAGSGAILVEVEAFVRQQKFIHQMPAVAEAQVLILLRQGNLQAAAHLAETHELPTSQARVYLAQGDPAAALAVLEPLRHQVEAKGWQDEQLEVMILEAIAYQALGQNDLAVQMLAGALALAEPGGFIRIFVDEGPPMVALLQKAAKDKIAPNYVSQLRAAFGQAGGRTPGTQLLVEPLSDRELEVLRLLGTESNGPEIARQLMVSLSTLRTHTHHIYSKLGVNNRRAAVRCAKELGLL
jgi:LuxR family transcriptional regulator, maltose regulon positive regulatory protein